MLKSTEVHLILERYTRSRCPHQRKSNGVAQTMEQADDLGKQLMQVVYDMQ